MATDSVSPPIVSVISNTVNPNDPANQKSNVRTEPSPASPPMDTESIFRAGPSLDLGAYPTETWRGNEPNFQSIGLHQRGIEDIKNAAAGAGSGDEWAKKLTQTLHPDEDTKNDQRFGLMDTYVTTLDFLGKSRNGGDPAQRENLQKMAESQARDLGVSDVESRAIIAAVLRR